MKPIVMQRAQPSAPTRAFLTARAQRYDSLWIAIRGYRQGEERYYQATLQQRGTAVLVDSFRRPELVLAVDVQSLRRSYEQQLQLMHELAAAGLAISANTLDLQGLHDLGRRVAQALPPSVRQGIGTAVLRARRRRRGLRVTLELAGDVQDLLAIPWELIVLPLTRGVQVDERSEEFLLLNADITLIRQVQGIGRNTPPALTEPLKLQAFAATPADAAPIAIVAPTRAAIAQVLPPDAVEHCWYDGADTLRSMQERLRTTSPQILHLLCHGARSDTGRGIRSDLLFTHADGYTQRVSAVGLAPALTLAADLQMVLLQACHAGASAAQPEVGTVVESERQANESIALALIRRGVPVVVAMQGAVGQAAAGAFVEACYAAIAHGESIDRAIAAGRVAMWSAGGLVDWSLPVVYQGSGQPEADTWYARLADRVDGALHDSVIAHTLRGYVIALALVLLITGILRWLLLPSPTPLVLDIVRLPLAAWMLLGLVGPAVIAAAHEGVRERTDLSAAVRRAALRAQWMGAYLGYVLGGLMGMLLLTALWLVGLLDGLPMLPIMLVGVVLAGALFLSYAAARSQVRSALAIAPVEPALFGFGTLVIVIIAALALLAAPAGLFWLPGSAFAFLLDPAPGAIALSLALISLVLGLRR